MLLYKIGSREPDGRSSNAKSRPSAKSSAYSTHESGETSTTRSSAAPDETSDTETAKRGASSNRGSTGDEIFFLGWRDKNK